MSDPTQEAEAPEATAATTDHGPAESGTPEVDYEKRYQDLRPQYDRTQSELQALRQQQEAIRNDPEAQRKFLEELGYDLAEEEAPEAFEPDDDSPLTALEQRLAAIEAKEQQAEHDRQLEAAERHFNTAFTQLGESRGQPLTEEEQNAVIGLALTMPPGEDGMPPVEQAHQALEGIWEARRQAWADSKKTSHPFSPNGEAATEQPDLDDEATRQAWMAQRLADLDAG